MPNWNNYIRRYEVAIDTERRIARASLSANNVYRISTYKYTGGRTERLSGDKRTLLFVSGIFEGKVYGIKISYLKPETFFEWAKDVVTDTKVFEDDKKLISFNDLVPVKEKKGERMYNQHIKENNLIKKPQIPYRTYDIKGIRYISEVFFKKEILESYYG